LVAKKMSNASKRRLIRDFRKIKTENPSGISATPNQDDITKWSAIIIGFLYFFKLKKSPEERFF
jgi:ubiquitin-protein ligase